jgi:glycosyltransferase involved in cell wall biosynthesis
LRAELRLGPETRVVLFAGKLVSEKQPRELLAAFLRARVPETALVFVGEGAEKTQLIADAGAATPETPVHFLPFSNQTEMPARYLLADVFALPSRGCYETWGLAVNEAMQMGVPALVSDRVGCQRDLVIEGATGWVFSNDDVGALTAALARALAAVRDKGERERLRRHVRAHIAGYSYAAAAEGLTRAVAQVTAAK